MIVDFHVHIFPPQIQADRAPYLERDPVFRSIYGRPRARIATAEELIESMDRCGVDVAVVQGFGWASHALCVEHNSYLLDACARHPGRLIPFCAVQPLAAEAALGEVRRCAAGGARGLGELRADEQGFAQEGWPAVQGVYAAARHRDLVVLLHASEPVGHLYAGKGAMTPDHLYSFISIFPEWPVVLAHLGGGLPFYAAMPEVGAALTNTYVDTAAWPLLYGPEVFPPLLQLIGEEKVLFGSDFPLLEQGAEIERVRRLSLPGKGTEARVLGGNAARLLGLGDG